MIKFVFYLGPYWASHLSKYDAKSGQMKTFLRRSAKLILGLILLLAGTLFFSDWWVSKQAAGKTFDAMDELPYNPTGIVLGTSKRVRGGGENLFFKYRMQAAFDLYRAGKIKYIIVSGDNSIMEYNETRDMKAALIELGIPEESIIEDFAGFRTLDSVLRAKEVFGRDSLTIISQQFHNERAIFIAENHDIYALGYNSKDPPKKFRTMTMLREYLARVKAMADIYLLGTMPKFYKDKEIFPDE